MLANDVHVDYLANLQKKPCRILKQGNPQKKITEAHSPLVGNQLFFL